MPRILVLGDFLGKVEANSCIMGLFGVEYRTNRNKNLHVKKGVKMEEDNDSVWYIPTNEAGRYRLAIQVVQHVGRQHVFLRSELGSLEYPGKDEFGFLKDELGFLMSQADIGYLIGGKFPLSFEEAISFMDKQTALKRAKL